jgi:hypothetical protein
VARWALKRDGVGGMRVDQYADIVRQLHGHTTVKPELVYRAVAV